MTLTPGQILKERYRIVELLGEGGFGAVYRAWDMNLNGPCAVKESFDVSPAAQSQFAREASILFNMRHPNLPRVFDSFSLPGQGRYLVMDYIQGEDLDHMIERTGMALTESQALPWIIQVCDALSYLHSQNPPVIHRDIKPANIRITPDGQAMLVDFGIAKMYNPELKTTVGARAVTPGFSPPEQYGQGATDAQSDVYALGATLYALLTGQMPPDSVDLLAGNAAPPAPARVQNPTISSGVSAAIEKAMQLSKTQRYRSAAEFKAALQSVLLAAPLTGVPASVTSAVVVQPAPDIAPPTPSALSQDRPASQPVARQDEAAVRPARGKLPWIIAGAAGMLVVCFLLFVAARFILRQFSGQSEQAKALEATQTALDITLSAPSPTSPPIPTVVPTRTSTPTPTRSPAKTLTSSSPLPFQADFSAAGTQLLIFCNDFGAKSGECTYKYEDGELVAKASGEHIFGFTLNLPELADVRLELDFRLLEYPSTGFDYTGVDIGARDHSVIKDGKTQWNYVALRFIPALRILKKWAYENGKPHPVDVSNVKSLKLDGSANHVVVFYKGSTVSVSLNGQDKTSLQDPGRVDQGKINITLVSEKGAAIQAAFDNLKVSLP